MAFSCGGAHLAAGILIGILSVDSEVETTMRPTAPEVLPEAERDAAMPQVAPRAASDALSPLMLSSSATFRTCDELVHKRLFESADDDLNRAYYYRWKSSGATCPSRQRMVGR